MAKLVLRQSCYNGLKNVKKSKVRNDSDHMNHVKEANERIEKKRICYAVAYKNAGSYLGQ